MGWKKGGKKRTYDSDDDDDDYMDMHNRPTILQDIPE